MTQTAMDLPGRDAVDDSHSLFGGVSDGRRPESTAPSKLVWLEDGAERVFDDAESNTRTWLEVSSEWVSPARRDDVPRKPSPPDKLIWV